ncbi:MAG: transposase [Acidimicrobiales bacterium]
MQSPMDNPPEVVAQFRYTVIAPLVVRKLAYGEQRALVQQQAAQVWTWPDGQIRVVHPRTIVRWVTAYRSGGLPALQPGQREDRPGRRVPAAVLDRAVALRTEDPHRSARQIIQMLEWAGEIEVGTLKHSTLTYHFRKVAAAAYVATPPADTFRRRQAPHYNAEWQGDSQLTLSLPDPNHPDRRKKVYLIAFIDDATRYVVGSRFFFDENRPRLEEVLKWAIIRHGIPEILHVDNGSIYASHYLSRICAELGIDLRHSRPYRPAGKGKIERLFLRVDQQLTHELQGLIDAGTCQTLDDLNRYWEAWLEQGYHQQDHRSLHTTPQAAWDRSHTEHGAPRTQPVAEIQRIFLWHERRKVDKTGVIQLAGNRYEVDLALLGKWVDCRYDPFSLEKIHISCQGTLYPDATPLVLQHHRHREAPTTDLPPAAPATGLNLAQLAADRKATQDAAQQAGIRYAQPTPAGAGPHAEEGPYEQ